MSRLAQGMLALAAIFATAAPDLNGLAFVSRDVEWSLKTHAGSCGWAAPAMKRSCSPAERNDIRDRSSGVDPKGQTREKRDSSLTGVHSLSTAPDIAAIIQATASCSPAPSSGRHPGCYTGVLEGASMGRRGFISVLGGIASRTLAFVRLGSIRIWLRAIESTPQAPGHRFGVQ